MSQPYRLAGRGRIDVSQPLTFSFNGRRLTAFKGDTAASALLANGIHFCGRSFKYHRPRGILTAGSEEPNALLDVDRGNGRRDPNNRATVVEVTDGMTLRSQNHYPSLETDVGALNDRLSPMFAAGFYYKTFMWPKAAWTRLYEPIIRRAAGLGSAPDRPDPDRYVHHNATCDVLIVGLGPTGLAAARAAAKSGKRVIACDEQAEPGGALLHDATSTIDGLSASQWVAEAIAELDTNENVILLPRTTAFGYFNHNHIALAERVTDHLANPPSGLPRERLWQVRAGEVVIAAGSHERPLVFADNDRPGILLADAIRTYLNRYGVAPGDRTVIATSGASAYQTALDLNAAGREVRVVDLRLAEDCGAELEAAKTAGIEVFNAHTVVGASGKKRVDGLLAAPIKPDGSVGEPITLSCDCVGMSGGWTPAVHLFSQSRGKLTYDTQRDAFLPGASVQQEQSAGACNGAFALDACLREGARAGAEAVGRATDAPPLATAPTFTGFQPVRVMPSSADPAKTRAFIDFQNDVTAKDIKLAVREGFESIEHVKRYTTTGMATDQGKTSNMNALGLVAGTLSRELPKVGTTTFRLPYTPVTFGALAGQNRGDLFDPIRKTPVHAWALQRGAKFEDVGNWKRAWFFPEGRETMDEAVARECLAVRERVGLFDASTLGKIEVVGPDAAEFLNRVYTNGLKAMPVGRCRYGLMLGEDGYIMDDGVVARLADDRFHITTTTGGAPRVLAHMEDYLQTEWSDLDVFLTSTTEQWAVIAVQGPRARDVIAPFVTGADLSNGAMPHMSVRTCDVCGVEARLMRMSFTGELGYEINVPASRGLEVWEMIWAAGEPHGMCVYGTETMHVLRAERGFIIVGQDTDGTMSPDDVGLDGLVSKKKADFIGKRSLARPDLVADGRKQLVGLRTAGDAIRLDEGAQIVDEPDHPKPVPMLGHVTSSYQSAALGHPIALGVVKDGRARLGDTVHVTTAEGFTTAEIVAPIFIDAEGVRVHG
ncbi:MAG: sarcosine oxidase subunit alpha family protein [Pseudomonadota bacterium]